MLWQCLRYCIFCQLLHVLETHYYLHSTMCCIVVCQKFWTSTSTTRSVLRQHYPSTWAVLEWVARACWHHQLFWHPLQPRSHSRKLILPESLRRTDDRVLHPLHVKHSDIQCRTQRCYETHPESLGQSRRDLNLHGFAFDMHHPSEESQTQSSYSTARWRLTERAAHSSRWSTTLRRSNSSGSWVATWFDNMPTTHLHLRLTSRRKGMAWSLMQKERPRHIRHSQLNYQIRMAIKNVHLPATKEPIGLSRTDGKRPDGATLTPWTRGKQLAWDIIVPDTYAQSHI